MSFRRALATLRQAALVVVLPGSRVPTEPRKASYEDKKKWTDAEWEQQQMLRAVGKKSVIPRPVYRTWLGDEIVKRYEGELSEPGRKIRWDGRLDDALAAAIARCSHRQG